MLIDTHAHLADQRLIANIDKIIQNASGKSVRKIVSIGCSLHEAGASIQLAERHKGVFATVGLYPHDNGDEAERRTTKDKLKKVEELAKHPKVVAIGECGFDFSPPPQREKERGEKEQEELFRKQIGIARKQNLPVIIHSRNAKNKTLAVLENEAKSSKFKAVWHCFTEDMDTVRRLIDLDILISFTGIITYPSGKNLHEIVAFTPIRNIVVETDAPHLVPQKLRSEGVKLNEPQYVRMIAEKIAEIKGIPIEEVEERTTDNAAKLFALPH